MQPDPHHTLPSNVQQVAPSQRCTPDTPKYRHCFRLDGGVHPACVDGGLSPPDRQDKMLSRVTRLAPLLPRVLANNNNGGGLRFVSQSQPSPSTGSATLSELQPAAVTEHSDGHGEVNEYVKVSSPTDHGTVRSRRCCCPQ